MYPHKVGVTVPEKYCVPIGAAPASAGRTSRNTTIPSTAPQDALTMSASVTFANKIVCRCGSGSTGSASHASTSARPASVIE